MRRYRALLILILLTTFAAACRAATAPDESLCIGFGQNTLQAKYQAGKNVCLAGSVSYGEGVWVMGGATLLQRRVAGGHLAYIGAGYDWVTFSDGIKGYGLIVEVPVGIELFISEKLSFETRLSPSYVYLKTSTMGMSESGMDYILNLFINFYLR